MLGGSIPQALGQVRALEIETGELVQSGRPAVAEDAAEAGAAVEHVVQAVAGAVAESRRATVCDRAGRQAGGTRRAAATTVWRVTLIDEPRIDRARSRTQDAAGDPEADGSNAGHAQRPFMPQARNRRKTPRIAPSVTRIRYIMLTRSAGAVMGCAADPGLKAARA